MASEIDSFGTPLCSLQPIARKLLTLCRDQRTSSNFVMIDKYVINCHFSTRILHAKTVKGRKRYPESETGKVFIVCCY